MSADVLSGMSAANHRSAPMTRLAAFVFLAVLTVPVAASADPHDEMAAALEAQIDTQPAPAALPVVGQTVRTAVTRPTTPRVAVSPSTHAVARVEQALAGLSIALLRQTQAATQAAAGQAQAQAAKDRRNPR